MNIEEEYRGTLRRAKDGGLTSIWSGDLRNEYLRNALQFAVDQGIVELEPYDHKEAQESGFNVTWLKEDF